MRTAIGRLRKRAWRRAGRRANLRPQDGTCWGTPDLVGTATDGRTVRASTISRGTEGTVESGTTSGTDTVVEGDRREPEEEGLVRQVEAVTALAAAVERETEWCGARPVARRIRGVGPCDASPNV